MRVALPILDDRLCPVADVATLWRIYTSQGEVVEDVNVEGIFVTSYPTLLIQHGIGLILCSTLSPLLWRLFHLQGIKVLPGWMGKPEEVIKQWLQGSPPPWGCHRGRRHRHRRRHGHFFRR